MEDRTPKAPVARFGIDPGGPEGEQHVCSVVQGAKVLHTLQEGEDWNLHPKGGIIVVHPQREPVWVREVDGEIVRETLRPGPPVLWVGGYAMPLKPR